MKLPSSFTPATTQRSSTLLANLTSIHERIQHVTNSRSISKPIRLVAVSKLKPVSDIIALSSTPTDSQTQQRLQQEWQPQEHFGENYVGELLEKSRLISQYYRERRQQANDGDTDGVHSSKGRIKWHFIGGLQSNKCVQLARDVEDLWAVRSVDSIKKARLLDRGWRERGQRRRDQNGSTAASEEEEEEEEDGRLRISIQINTSGESSKSGVAPKSDELLDLARFVLEECRDHLNLQGVMTIGAIARSVATTPENENDDFISLRENRDWLADRLGLTQDRLELSMGMSEDFEGAIALGSDEVRIGSTIFGERPPKKEAKVV